jgi:hypothetical protein
VHLIGAALGSEDDMPLIVSYRVGGRSIRKIVKNLVVHGNRCNSPKPAVMPAAELSNVTLKVALPAGLTVNDDGEKEILHNKILTVTNNAVSLKREGVWGVGWIPSDRSGIVGGRTGAGVNRENGVGLSGVAHVGHGDRQRFLLLGGDIGDALLFSSK